MGWRRARLLALPLVALALLASCVAGAATTLWPTYHLDPGRSGNDASEPSFASMFGVWNSSALDGAIYAEPLVDGSNIIVATEHNSLYALDASTGAVRWGPVSLGVPRTQNFPCGDINPLGITGTPVIDGGSLYAVAEVETSPTTFEFHLAKVDPSSGAVAYNTNITPSGMDGNVQQERSALAVSNGNVVIAWGGLDGDCGNFHGFLETVAESTGTAQHQWSDTTGGREGGMWAPSGPAVDGVGNIYVATGNGSSNTITTYDYGDSVLKFDSALTPQSFFAPGSPQPWASLNATDTDLGSVDPVLLTNGTMFEIGKGGRGYLLNQSSLPSSSNPGGGENFSAQVCTGGAFGGMAVNANIVFVPCTDGIAAVSIDSTSAFHRVWYQMSGGGGPPIIAGGLVWTTAMFGGSRLFGLQMSTGAIAANLTLPGTTQHFVTPVAGDGRIYAAAGNRVGAFAPASQIGPGSAQNPAAAADSSGRQEVVWRGTDNGIWEARWSSAGWTGPSGHGMGPLASPPAIAIRPSGEADVFWKGTDANLWEAIDVRGTWTGPFYRGMGPLGSAPTVAAWGSEVDVFWEGTDRQLWEGYETGTAWHGPMRIGMGPLGSQPTAAAHTTGEQDVFWEGTDSNLWEGYWNGRRWNGPQGLGMGPLTSQPTAGVLASGEQDVLWRGTDNGIWMTAYRGSGWIGPTGVGMGPLGSPPAVAAWGTEVDAFWQGTDRNLWEAYRPRGGTWLGPGRIGMGPLG